MSWRAYQKILYLASFFLAFKEPKVISGPNCVLDIYKTLLLFNKNHPLIITDNNIYCLDIFNKLKTGLLNNDIQFDVYHDVRPNPSKNNVYDALKVYMTSNCDSIIAFGGGSSIDTAKVVGALLANPNKTIDDFRGILKVRKRYESLIAIPTTAGTGSEATVAAVIVDDEKHDKYAINDPKLIPHYAYLDPTLLIDLPQKITATTGMDALTHAIEAYIGHSNTKKTKQYALESIKLVFDNLELSAKEPKNLVYRENMLLASYKAGVSFTRAYVGYVHAIAHSLGGLYNIPHGYANAILLPKILRSYGKSCWNKLAKIYDYLYPSNELNSKENKANRLIYKINLMNNNMNIKEDFSYIKEEDISFIAEHSYKEANPLYPVPKEFDLEDFISIIVGLKNGSN